MTQKMEKQALSYRLADFLKYKDINSNIPKDINPYCFNSREFNTPNINPYMDQIEAINSLVVGNAMDKIKVFIKIVKLCINTLTKKKYNKCIGQLTELDYSNEINVQILIEELITCGIRCPISIKGYSRERNNLEQNTKPVSELCSDMIKHFSQTMTKKTNNNIGFKDELLKICRKMFLDFVNLSISMDENNMNTVDNYSGFTTLFGLMYLNGLVSIKIIIECFDMIKRTIFSSKLESHSKQFLSQTSAHNENMFGYKNQYNTDLYDTIVYYDTEVHGDDIESRLTCYRKLVECTNYYKGYEHIMQFVISSFETKIKEYEKNISDESISDETKNNSINKITEHLEIIINEHQKFINLNQKFKAKNKNQFINPLRPHVVIIHNGLGNNLNTLADMVEKYNHVSNRYKEVEISK
jgi:hypothetical protein